MDDLILSKDQINKISNKIADQVISKIKDYKKELTNEEREIFAREIGRTSRICEDFRSALFLRQSVIEDNIAQNQVGITNIYDAVMKRLDRIEKLLIHE